MFLTLILWNKTKNTCLVSKLFYMYERKSKTHPLTKTKLKLAFAFALTAFPDKKNSTLT